ncbi:KCNF1 [Symbiodinium pilosum]|uniref:KCNF1 protein n=1 Tax=Symbiodinium pilosum TaxID=2952 RepID=A0A812JUN9_SYMPI|nr:KCNF1 [Symbiodinium pilosum]
MGKVTFSKRASRISSVTFNATFTNTGSTPWSSAVLQAVHGSDMGVSSLPLAAVVEPGADYKVSVRLRLPQADEDAIPTSMWALSMGDRVFGPLLLLELEQQEDVSLDSLLQQAQQTVEGQHEISARVHEAPKLFLEDEVFREDPVKVRDVSEDWANDLANFGMAQAYQIGSIAVSKSLPARMASFDLLVHLTNTGRQDWPEKTALRLVSGRSLGCEVLPITEKVSPGASANVHMKLQVPTQDDPAETVQDSVWALADDNQFFGPLLILELRHVS